MQLVFLWLHAHTCEQKNPEYPANYFADPCFTESQRKYVCTQVVAMLVQWIPMATCAHTCCLKKK